eukprot:6187489-Pleurochrysis_carterae.AAC.2
MKVSFVVVVSLFADISQYVPSGAASQALTRKSAILTAHVWNVEARIVDMRCEEEPALIVDMCCKVLTPVATALFRGLLASTATG